MRHNDRVVKNILSMLQAKGCLKEPLQNFSHSSDSRDSESPDRSGSNSPERKVIEKSRSASLKSSVPPKNSPRYSSRSKSPVPTVSKTNDPPRTTSTDSRSMSPASHPSPSKSKRSARSPSSSSSSDSDSDTDYKRRKKRSRVNMSGSDISSGSKILRKRELSQVISSPGSVSKKKRNKSIISKPKSDLSAEAQACASISVAKHNPDHNIPPVTFTLNMRTDVKHQVALLMADMRRQSLTFYPNSDPILAKLQTNNNLPICSYYQVGLCTKLSHKSAFNTASNPTYLHICAFCISKLKLASGHDFSRCPYVIFKKTD